MTLYVNHESLNKISQSLSNAGADLDSASCNSQTGCERRGERK
jgi:hypothetical protein